MPRHIVDIILPKRYYNFIFLVKLCIFLILSWLKHQPKMYIWVKFCILLCLYLELIMKIYFYVYLTVGVENRINLQKCGSEFNRSYGENRKLEINH